MNINKKTAWIRTCSTFLFFERVAIRVFSRPELVANYRSGTDPTPTVKLTDIFLKTSGGKHIRIKKALYLLLGCISLVLGAIGAFLPMLPCAPFLLLATFCFTKSSDRLHAWFIQTKLYQNNLESLVKGRGMTKKSKLQVISIVTATMLIGFILMRATTIGRVVLCIIWICHLLYFVFSVKTIAANDLSNDKKSQPPVN